MFGSSPGINLTATVPALPVNAGWRWLLEEKMDGIGGYADA
jgi:hypothetical protein